MTSLAFYFELKHTVRAQAGGRLFFLDVLKAAGLRPEDARAARRTLAIAFGGARVERQHDRLVVLGVAWA